MVQNGSSSVPSWVSCGAAAIGSTVQNAEPGPDGRTIPVTSTSWPAVRSREPTCRPSRAAVAVVTATWNTAVPCLAVTVTGSDPATRADCRARVLR